MRVYYRFVFLGLPYAFISKGLFRTTPGCGGAGHDARRPLLCSLSFLESPFARLAAFMRTSLQPTVSVFFFSSLFLLYFCIYIHFLSQYCRSLPYSVLCHVVVATAVFRLLFRFIVHVMTVFQRPLTVAVSFFSFISIGICHLDCRLAVAENTTPPRQGSTPPFVSIFVLTFFFSQSMPSHLSAVLLLAQVILPPQPDFCLSFAVRCFNACLCCCCHCFLGQCSPLYFISHHLMYYFQVYMHILAWLPLQICIRRLILPSPRFPVAKA